MNSFIERGSVMRYSNIYNMLATVLLAMAITGGCENSGAPEGKPAGLPVIGVFVYDKKDVYLSMVTRAMEQKFAGKAKIVIQYADSDQLVQNDQLRSFLAQKADALVVNLVEPQTALMPLKEAQRHDMPIVFFNREPDINALKRYTKAAYVGTDATEAGKMQGELIHSLWTEHPEYDRNGDGLVQYVMIQGNSDSPEALARTEHSVAEAQKRGLRMCQLGETYVCDWGREQASQAMRLVMGTHSNAVELVLSNNDAMALGAIDVLKEHGYNTGDLQKYIPVIGVDAIPAAIEAVRTNSMSATVKQDSEAMGRAVAAMTLNALANKQFLEGTSHTWDKSGVAVRIPYVPFRP